MIQTHSSTAQRTESLKLSEPDDGHSAKRRRLYEESKRQPPRCEECGAKVNYLKAADRWIFCEQHSYRCVERQEGFNVARGKRGAKTTQDPKPPSGNTSLETLRRESGLTRTALSRASGVGADTIRAFETGKTAYLKPATRKALWRVLGEI
jgi:hypothetical protein